jgi:hypothetical protein
LSGSTPKDCNSSLALRSDDKTRGSHSRACFANGENEQDGYVTAFCRALRQIKAPGYQASPALVENIAAAPPVAGPTASSKTTWRYPALTGSA